MNKTSTSPWRRCRLLGLAFLAACSLGVTGQTIPNPSFETDTFTVWPGYISDNSPITGWTANAEYRAGLNPATGSPFADNGAIPDGNNVAFLQSDVEINGTTLETTITGLTAGTTYKVMFRANARAAETPNLMVMIDYVEVLYATIYPVTETRPYAYIAFEFTASANQHLLTLLNDAAGDHTAVFDSFTIAPTSGRWVVAPWSSDEDSGVDANYVYTHAYNFGTGDSTMINGITFTGAAEANPAVTGKFSTTFLGNVFNGDNDAALTGGSQLLGRDFVYSGASVTAGSFQSIKIDGLTEGVEYVATIYSVGFDNPGPTIRWATFSVGDDRLTVNQDQFGNNAGIRLSYRYTADASGSVTLNYAPLNPANVSIHTYGFSNREAVSRNVAPEITGQPGNLTVAVNQPATFRVTATGIPAPTYQWRFKGTDIAGATEPTYSIPSAAPANVGAYDVVVRNSMGTVTSSAATLTVGIAMSNPSFEEDIFDTYPGYVSGNWDITAWTALGGHGLNPTSDGQSPFADNGMIPHGAQVAFMQADGALSQTVTGLTVGADYYLHYYENARSVTTVPSLEAQLGGVTVVPAHSVPPVRGGAYYEVYGDAIEATAAELLLSFIKGAPAGGDCTALIDNVAIVEIPAGTAPFVTRNPASATVSVGDTATFSVQGIGSLPLAYQWFKNGDEIAGATGATLTLSNVQKVDEGAYSARVNNSVGPATSAAAALEVYEPIPDLYSTGLDDARAPLADGAVDPHYTLIQNPDVQSTDAIVQDTTVFPISDGTWLPASSTSKWIGPRFNTAASAVGIFVYRTTFDLTERDPSTVIIEGRWSTDNAGNEILVNGVATANAPNTGFNLWTPFTIRGTEVNLVAGLNTIDFVVENVAAIGYTGLRVEILHSNVDVPPGKAPEIILHPLSQTVVEGSTVTLTANCVGTAPLSFQWSKDGAPIDGATGLSLTLSNVTAEDSGSYAFSASNAVGSAASNPAYLCVCLRPVPGIFGTGLDASGALLGDGEVDPHYTLVASADPSWPGPDAITVNAVWPIQAGVWALNGPNSRWISAQADQSGTVGNMPGDYTYRTTFDLTGIDPAKFQLIGGWATDNAGLGIVLNGTSTGLQNPAQFASLTAFTLTSGFVAGVNTLDFIVNNAPDPNNPELPGPTGLRVDLKGYLVTGEPPSKPSMTIARDGANITVSWTPATASQELHSAPAVTGPWTKITGATSPYATTASDSAKFFRVVNP
ncbi:MAG TPA: immunoglobulin domain-containing protein [Verrucomicrobiota bacterium]|nr:immunoglobulin domain-containing protein [Verrucomicrobiota bacterium]HRZ55403.1 immunoglobulin domain-containing protein [Candidatus Paceibacterota bacterium]